MVNIYRRKIKLYMPNVSSAICVAFRKNILFISFFFCLFVFAESRDRREPSTLCTRWVGIVITIEPILHTVRILIHNPKYSKHSFICRYKQQLVDWYILYIHMYSTVHKTDQTTQNKRSHDFSNTHFHMFLTCLLVSLNRLCDHMQQKQYNTWKSRKLITKISQAKSSYKSSYKKWPDTADISDNFEQLTFYITTVFWSVYT